MGGAYVFLCLLSFSSCISLYRHHLLPLPPVICFLALPVGSWGEFLVGAVIAFSTLVVDDLLLLYRIDLELKIPRSSRPPILDFVLLASIVYICKNGLT